MNQQGALGALGALPKDCSSSQNGRGGMFFVIENQQLFASLTELLKGESAPSKSP